ncbi:MBL fold metallo-hydrolase [Halanaerobaculum tunisiense]
METNIYHLYHSGLAVETENYLLVFDYYNDTPANGNRTISQGVMTREKLAEKENVLVFVTHSHHDHFNPVIFDWATNREDIKYILSSDLPVSAQENYFKVAKYQNIEVAGAQIETYGTTDQGLSFYVEVDGFNIFHSGDLNWWHWKKFTPAERKREEEDYKAEVAKLEGKAIDFACVPVDPRLEEYYYLAGEYFAQTIKPELIIPIHFSDNYQITADFRAQISDLAVEAAEINERGEKLTLKK